MIVVGVFVFVGLVVVVWLIDLLYYLLVVGCLVICELGMELFGCLMLIFEIVGVMLLVMMIGIVVLFSCSGCFGLVDVGLLLLIMMLGGMLVGCILKKCSGGYGGYGGYVFLVVFLMVGELVYGYVNDYLY